MSAHSARSFPGSLTPWLPALAPWVVVAGLTYCLGGGETPTVQAQGGWAKDLDQDGLPDGQERILGADSALADTDGDGFSDGYEFAAQTSLVDPLDVPELEDVSVNITVRGGFGDSARILIAVLTSSGTLDQAAVRFGAILGAQRLNIPWSFILQRASSNSVDQPDGSKLFLWEFRVPGSLMQSFGELTYFVAGGSHASGTMTSAAVADILVQDGIASLRIPLNSFTFSQGNSLNVFRPIPGGGQAIPDTWTQGALCVKEIETQSQSGAVLTMFVNSAGCSSPFHSGSCPPDCEASTGTSFTTVDPFILVGG